ncbi:TPA: tail fiber protein [Escherichia coli]
MAQQISDLVINLDVDSATFSEQVARIKGQLTGMAEDSEKVQTRMQRASERQAAAFKTVGDAGAAAAADMKSRQSAATEGLTKDWQNVSKSVDETHRRVTELNQRMRENDGQAAALARRQDELAASFFRQIDGVRQLNGETQSLANVQARFRAARAQGNITQQDYLALISRTTARQKELQIVEEKSAAARTRFLSQLKQQVAEQKLSGTELLRMKAAQVGASDAAEVYIRKLEAAKVATHGLGLQSAAARQELGILIGEVMRGNFGALRGSGITLATGWLKCNGAAFSAEEYPELAKAYPTNKLPDLRGEFIRGWDDGRGIDAGRALLSLQNGGVESHTHQGQLFRVSDYRTKEIPASEVMGRGYIASLTPGADSPLDFDDYSVSSNPNGYFVGNQRTTAYGVNETRPRNIAFNYIVRAA